MERKQFLVGPHGGHNCLYGDDGLKLPWQMVKAAWEQGIVPAQTSHNTMLGIGDYLEAMNYFFGPKLALPGVELSFRITNFDPAVTADPGADESLRFFFPPSVLRFVQDRHSGLEKSVYLTPAEIRAAQEKIRICFEAFFEKPYGQVKAMFKKGSNQYFWDILAIDLNYDRIQRKLLKANPETKTTPDDVLDLAIGQRAAVTEPGFPAFLALVEKQMAEEAKGDTTAHTSVSEALKISYLGLIYYNLNKTKRLPPSNAKGEIVVLMPPELPLINKVAGLVEFWRENNLHIKACLNDLFNLFEEKLTEGESDALVWYLPHPTSIDITRLGKAILIIKEKGVVGSLFSPEIFIPEVAERIHVIETYNAAHPPIANETSGRIATIKLFETKARAGASDSHHPVWVGAGATLVAAAKLTAYGILEAFKRGDTLPISGLGERSNSWKAFFYWLGTIPIFGLDLVPDVIREKMIGEKIDIRTPASRAIESGVIFQRKKPSGWIY